MAGANGLEAWVRGVLLWFWRASPLVHYREVQGTHWKLRAIWEEWESERSQIFQKDFGWRNAGAVERRARADWS